MVQSRAGEFDVVGIPDAEDELTEVVRLLRRDVAAIDRLWNEARTTPGGTTLAVALGEASHGVHRALIALTNQAAPEPAAVLSRAAP